MQLQYNAYQQVAAQLLAAEAKVQEETPAFTTLQSATVPVMKAGPKRAQMCLIFVFLAFLGTTGWIIYKEDDWKQFFQHDTPKLKGEEPDFSEEGWARRKRKK
jgi:hypothetical protein